MNFDLDFGSEFGEWERIKVCSSRSKWLHINRETKEVGIHDRAQNS